MRLRGARAPKFGFWSEGRGGVPIYKLVIALMEDGFKPTLASPNDDSWRDIRPLNKLLAAC